MSAEQPSEERRRRAVLMAVLLGVVALGIYLGFILVNLPE
jgi:hypothetical protein